jgi:REP element-mobilizing transposase RayT
VAHVRRPVLSGRHPLHVTWRVVPEVWNLRIPVCYGALRDAFTTGCDRFGFRLIQWSIQSNHLHLVVEADDRQALARGLKGLGVRVARRINRIMRRRGAVLADRFHAHVLRRPREVRNALLYVLNNARRHQRRTQAALRRGLGFDPYSSAWWFDGWKPPGGTGPVAIPRAVRERPPPVAPADTWLLRVGWRRAGLLHPHEAPVDSTSGAADRRSRLPG